MMYLCSETALLQSMMEGTAHLISNKVGLSDPQCLHETCRLIGRINTSSQFKELKQVWYDLRCVGVICLAGPEL